jgi:hypothetical protein
MESGPGAAGTGGWVVRMMTPAEQAALVDAIVARRDEEADYQAAALATALAARIDLWVQEIDALLVSMEVKRTRRSAA